MWKNKNVAMFIDMDGTINEYVVYSEATVSKQMEDGYTEIAPVLPVINVLEEISHISNIDIYILSLSKQGKFQKKKYLAWKTCRVYTKRKLDCTYKRKWWL